MTLSKYLGGVPKANQQAAASAMAQSLYTQHLRLLRSAATLSNPKEIDETIKELQFLVEDAKALVETGLLNQHPSIHRAKKVAELNLDTVLASLRFSNRHPIK